MSTPSSRKTYTRRNTRTRLIDILKEAIELVEKGCPPGHMTRGSVSTLAPMASLKPLSAVPEENLVAQSKSLLAASQVELEKGRALELQAQEFLKSQATAPPATATVTVKPKGAPRPGVLKYNKFVKDWISKHPEYQAKGKYQAALKEIQRSGNWDRVSGTRKKTKTAAVAATPARVSPPLALNSSANANANAVNANVNANANANAVNATPANANANANANTTPANTTPANTTPANANANAANATLATATSNTPYTNEGMNDTVGMRKISMNGRSLYMSSDNGLFERDGDAPGDFVGRLVDGKIVEENAPELPEYS
jgi:hypothetical protein